MIELTTAQEATICQLAGIEGQEGVTVERDEPHDEHVFATFYSQGGRVERIIDADGSYEQGED